MIIDLSQIEGASKGFDFTIGRDDLDFDIPAFRLTGDVQANGDVTKSAAQVEVKGHITANAEIDCTRCLNPVPRKMAIEFRATFIEPEHFASDREHEVSADDLDADQLEDSRLDLKEVVREQILLNIPEQVFCKEDCKGLCSKCGADRNLIDCKCDENELDPRWAALKNLNKEG